MIKPVCTCRIGGLASGCTVHQFKVNPLLRGPCTCFRSDPVGMRPCPMHDPDGTEYACPMVRDP